MLGPGVGGDRGVRVAGLARWVGAAVLVSVVVLAAFRGWYGLALVALGLGLGPYLGRALSRPFRGRRASLAVAVALGVAGVFVANLGFFGFLDPARVGGVGLWAPAAALLLAAVPRPVMERERLKEADKLRMMLDLYPHPEGGRWTAERVEEATDGEVDARTFRDVLEARGEVVSSLGMDPMQDRALARAMDFPMELWYRRIEWWEDLYGRWERGEDVSDRLQEWDCVTPERAAERLGVSPGGVMEMISVGELEARRGRDGTWQVREDGVFLKEMEKDGKDSALIPPPAPRSARPGRTGTANHLDRGGRPF